MPVSVFPSNRSSTTWLGPVFEHTTPAQLALHASTVPVASQPLLTVQCGPSNAVYTSASAALSAAVSRLGATDGDGDGDADAVSDGSAPVPEGQEYPAGHGPEHDGDVKPVALP